jgi:hypothetical protein
VQSAPFRSFLFHSGSLWVLCVLFRAFGPRCSCIALRCWLPGLPGELSQMGQLPNVLPSGLTVQLSCESRSSLESLLCSPAHPYPFGIQLSYIPLPVSPTISTLHTLKTTTLSKLQSRATQHKNAQAAVKQARSASTFHTCIHPPVHSPFLLE